MRVNGMVGLSIVLLVCWTVGATGDWFSEPETGGCQILDEPPGPAYQFTLGVVQESRFDGHGESTILETEADWEFAYFRDILGGDIDLNLRLYGAFFLDSADLQLPGQLAKLAFDLGYSCRFGDGLGLQVRAVPGLYSDLEDIGTGGFSVPFSLAMIRSFHPQLSGIAGLEIRPDFDLIVMPIVGVEWAAADWLRVKARLPESRVSWFVNPDWTTYLAFDWFNTTFDLREKDGHERGLITLQDFRAYWGLVGRVANDLHVVGEIGRTFNRSIEFEEHVEGQDSEVDIERALFLRVGVSGPF